MENVKIFVSFLIICRLLWPFSGIARRLLALLRRYISQKHQTEAAACKETPCESLLSMWHLWLRTEATKHQDIQRDAKKSELAETVIQHLKFNRNVIVNFPEHVQLG